MYGYHRDLHVLTHSFPTRRSSELANAENAAEHRMIGVADLKCLSADNGAARLERRSEATTNQRTAPIAPGHHLVQYFQRFGEQEAPVHIDAAKALTNAPQHIFTLRHPVIHPLYNFPNHGV